MPIKEIWKDIKGYEGLYKISNMGRVYSLLTEKFLKPGINNQTKYKAVVLYNKGKTITKKIHRLIAEHFIPNPENKSFIDHIDGNRQNNSISNLRWVTHKENLNNPLAKEKQHQGIIKSWEKRSRTKTFKQLKKVSKPVICIEANMIFPSINEAGRYLNLDARKICQACKGKFEKFGGYHWKYAEQKAC